MTDIAEYERRIAFALARIERSIAALPASGAVVPVMAPQDAAALPVAANPAGPDRTEASAELTELRAALATAQEEKAKLSERVQAIRDKQETTLAAMERQLLQALQTAEAAQAESARLRHANADLVAANRALLEASGDPAPHLVNGAMQAELDAMRAARAVELAEIDEILHSLAPLIGSNAVKSLEAHEDGRDA